MFKKIAKAASVLMLGSALLSSPAMAAAENPFLTIDSRGRSVAATAVCDRYDTTLLRGGREASGLAATGDRLLDGRTLVVRGDMNGDGRIDSKDVAKAAEVLFNPTALEREAGDFDGSGTFDIHDLAAISTKLKREKLPSIEELPPFEIGFFEDQAQAMADEINTYRVSLGLNPVELREDMSAHCQDRAEEMAEAHYYQHKRPDGRDFWDGAEFLPSSEVLQHCWVVPQEGTYMNAAYWAVDSWKSSPSHDAAIRDATAAYVGCGIAWGRNEENGMWQWVAVAQMGHVQD